MSSGVLQVSVLAPTLLLIHNILPLSVTCESHVTGIVVGENTRRHKGERLMTEVISLHLLFVLFSNLSLLENCVLSCILSDLSCSGGGSCVVV